ncbi:MAG: hybrid sensor histidine kinase/response regulator [Ginsengibacter sp.]
MKNPPAQKAVPLGIPVSQPINQDTRVTELAIDGAPASKLKILHLEDLESDAVLVSIRLKKINIEHEVLVVDNKADFITALENYFPDIILADHSLPAFNSMEALKILKEAGKKIPFILITATVSEEYAVQILKEGADDYILKDRPHRLPEAVISALKKYELEAQRDIFLKRILASEADLQIKNQQLIKYNQLVSHDLRSPVSNILLIAEIIDQVTDDAARKKLFSNLKNTAANINETLNLLVDVTKINEDLEPVSENLFFKEIFERQHNSLAILAQQLNSEFITDFTQCPSIIYPKAYLESIFLNLMSNSLKYSVPGRPPVISITSYKQSGRKILEFSDNGLGLNMKKFGEKLFGLNQTFHNNASKKGLGLFMIKKQIESEGGTIRANSKENEGLRFIIEFAA